MLEQAMDKLIDIEMDVGDDNFSVDNDSDGDGDEIDDDHKDGDGNEDDNCASNFASMDDDSSKRRLVDKTVKDPDNFSMIPCNMLIDESQLYEKYPKMKSTKAAFCDLNVGEILYLPASWWHQVLSFGGLEGHLAMNYWFHPPDASNNFEKPYSSDFWENDSKLRFTKDEN